MANTEKLLSNRDGNQTLQGAFNEEDFSLTTTGFLQGVIGRKVECDNQGAVEVYTFSENGTFLFEYTVTYADATKVQLLSAERTA
jgi:hypothetical protein